jgi:hypothetical protein
MSDNPNQRGQADRIRIDVSEEHECRYWTDKWNISPEELKRAVEKVGPMVKDVQRELEK